MKALSKYAPLFIFFCVGVMSIVTFTRHYKFLPYCYISLGFFSILNIVKLITKREVNVSSKYIVLFVGLLITIGMFIYFIN